MSTSRLAVAACLAILAFGVGSCGEPPVARYDPTEAGQRLPEVLAALRAGEPEAALVALARLREQGAVEGIDHYEAVAHLDAGQPAEALLALQRELAAHPGNGIAQLLMAEALLDMGRVAEAPPHLARATEMLSDTPYLSLVSGRVALALDDDAAAREQLLAYVAQDPISPRAAEAHHGLSQIARRLGDLELAERERETSGYLEKVNQFLNAYRQRLQDDPSDSEAALGVGMTFLDLYQHVPGDVSLLEQSEAAFVAVLRSAPANTRALFNLGFIATITNRPQLAHQRYAETLASDPAHIGALLNDGALALREGRHDQARGQLLKGLAAARETGDRVRARLELGRLAEAEADPAEAAVHYQAALAEDATDPRLAGLQEHLQGLLAQADG